MYYLITKCILYFFFYRETNKRNGLADNIELNDLKNVAYPNVLNDENENKGFFYN